MAIGESEFMRMLSFKAEAGIVPLVCWVRDEVYPEYLRMWGELKKANERIYELEFAPDGAAARAAREPYRNPKRETI